MAERSADTAVDGGVRIATLQARSILHVLAALDARDEIGAKLTSLASRYGLSVRGAGPGRWFAVASGRDATTLGGDLQQALGERASLLDQSDGQVALAIAGAQVRETLAKGTALDLRSDNFRVGDAASTLIGHIPVNLTRAGADEFEVLVPRSYAAGLWESLAEMAAEFGGGNRPTAIG